MSTIEILDALPKLSLHELQQVHQRILDLEGEREIVPRAELSTAIETGLRSLETEPVLEAAEVRQRIAGWAGRSA